MNHQTLLKQLLENLQILEQSMEVLRYSEEKCQDISWHHKHSIENLESMEALTARFARTADILTQKACKSLFLVLKEEIKTFIDGSNFLEKIGIVKNADDLLKIKDLRNQIAHEYERENLEEIVQTVLKYIPLIRKITQNLKNYVRQNFKNF